MANLFREAKQLLDKRDNGSELTEEEAELVATAIIPLMILPEYNDTPISQGLLELAKMMDGEKARVTKEEGK